MKHTERCFEDAIEQALTENGYQTGNPATYDNQLALFPEDILAVVRQSQAAAWQRLAEFYGDRAREMLLSALVKELDLKGSLQVLRHGFKCFGSTLRLAWFKPNSGLNPDTWADYENNLLKVYRQVHFSPKNTALSLDLVLAVGGIPVATVELKNPLTGQTVEDAKKQYQTDRDARELLFQFKKRTLVHFAVDPDWAFMTTQLANDDTRFLPFNQGFEHGAGNPPGKNENYRTTYLWEEVLTKDSLLDILGRYLHLETKERKVYTDQGVIKKKTESLIFPRYHQLDVVRRLVQHAREHGSGHNYLIQHSAGSGKSNSIAWLAYRLASLHSETDEKIFHSVIVITDRRVLDKQLQDTIHQFEHKQGVVQKIDKNTRQLIEALSSGVPIIVSTIQKFPFIAQTLEKLAKDETAPDLTIATRGKRFAVIVDEAHSSQSGEAAGELKKILNREGIEAAVAEQVLDLPEENLTEAAKAELIREMTKRARQPNLSFFAFTATPKFKTRYLFNEPGANGQAPFHLYSMRQAIEEGFILDVLKSYTTYKTYYGLIKSIEDDPNVPRRKTARKLARFLSLHPHNIGQKVEIIIEHFRSHTRQQIDCRAKAMVVTGSRLHAVRYKQAMDEYIQKKGYTDLRTLVAFSGTVPDDKIKTISYTEVEMNQGIKESELPDKFESYEYQVLIVAEKYQTGFDQPLLHTMYVDKRLAGVQAVQTLSRLNRKAPGKESTFVLDFVNSREEIFLSFKPYYEITLYGEITDPHLLYQMQHKIMEWQLFDQIEIDAFCNAWFGEPDLSDKKLHPKLNALLAPVVDRFNSKTEEEQATIKKQFVEFKNLYNFLSQIIPYTDSELEKLYVYLRKLLMVLPRRDNEISYDPDEDVALKHYRLQKLEEGPIQIQDGESPTIYGPNEIGTGKPDDEVPLSRLIDVLNARFSTEFTAADQIFFDQVKETAMDDKTLVDVALANSQENFQLIFNKMLEGLFLKRIDGNEDIFKRLMNDADFKHLVAATLVKEVYTGIRERYSA